MLPDDIDHIVIAVPNLAAAKESFRTVLGLTAIGGGRHDGVGTENLIIPLQGSYLELVTVVDRDLAEQNPFGRLVSYALRHQLILAGWAVEIGGRNTSGLTHQRLTRAGVAVDLYGVEEIIGASDRPFGLVRSPDQVLPGAGAVDAAALLEIRVVRPDEPEPLELNSFDAVLGRDGHRPGGHLSAVALTRADGSVLVIDQRTWELVSR
ncbi:VOC family protein [Mycolicibacterium komossense]|uniref:VOC family protein n=1 Tax=Mycolicibacterium komossense TaxID=1779 RepID=A0ABT3CIZ1_9MYCO|nr:VOC family protein [Mycolicibacterium komossense]MCV7229421.1 VOC family protein [Mycolicibacterium komossense]